MGRLEPPRQRPPLALCPGDDRGIAGLLADLGGRFELKLNGYGTGNKFPVQVALEDFLGVDFSDDVGCFGWHWRRLRWPILGLLVGGVVWGALGVKKDGRGLPAFVVAATPSGVDSSFRIATGPWIDQLQWPEEEQAACSCRHRIGRTKDLWCRIA